MPIPPSPAAPETSARSTWPYWIAAACLYLAAAPLGDEPHLFGKLRWVAGGANGMQVIDWFDLALHGLPLLAFLAWLVLQVLRKRNSAEQAPRG